jgi:hypothetical protein
LILFLAGCAPAPVEAPKDLDALFHFFLLGWESASDEELLAAAANLSPLVQESSRGLVTDVTDEEQATVSLNPPQDPSEATGLFVAGPSTCSLEELERAHYELDQEGLYEEATGEEKYIEYAREYTSDFDAYIARETAFGTWHTTYTVKPVLTQYTAEILGGLRYVPEADGVGPVIIDRAYLPSPATFEVETEDFFVQDYQLDILLPDGDTTVHAYGVWRDLQSAGLEDEDEGVQNLLLDGFEDFDADTELVCEGFR